MKLTAWIIGSLVAWLQVTSVVLCQPSVHSLDHITTTTDVWPTTGGRPSYENPVRSAAEDKITSLPGLDRSHLRQFNQYSGYLKGYQAPAVARFTHYWFIETQQVANAAEAPIIVWLSGGPGGSSMHGLFLENGPLEVAHDGKTLKLREISWNKLANLLYLESPSDVGYSYSPERRPANHSDTASLHEHMHALESFFAKFPHYANNPVFLVGQGYGGDYVISMARANRQWKVIKNLRGLAIGDAYLEDDYLATGTAFFAHDNNLIKDPSTWREVSNLCCGGRVPTHSDCVMKGPRANRQCEKLMVKVLADIVAAGVNPHNIHDRCSLFQVGASRSVRAPDFESPACETAGPLTKYLNTRKVRDALHIPARLESWQMFKNISYQYEGSTPSTGIFPSQLRDLVQNQRVPMLIYNGELDMLCNAQGNQWFIDSLNLNLISDFEPWRANGHVAGSVKRFDGLTFVKVHEAGKDVPRDRPAEAFQLIGDFMRVNMFMN